MITQHDHAGQISYDGPERRQHDHLRRMVAQMSREELERALFTDELTNLGNRRAFKERMSQEDEMVMMVDVNDLKWINDNFAHSAGDALLRNVAGFLRHLAVVHDGSAFRLSGDEFVLVLPAVDDEAHRLRALYRRMNDFQRRAIGWTDAAGRSWALTGATMMYGLGPTLAAADETLIQNKQMRQLAGLRVPRGERPTGLKAWRLEGEGNDEG